ncbi:MAG: hypothetical protein PHY29_05660 [Syntrophales bacterium]|nr:hypothetical protein [Syntrophales bacterium]
MKPKLTKREKLSVALGTSLVTIFLVLQFVLLPFLNAREKVRHSIEVNEKALEEIVALSAEYRALSVDSGDIGVTLARRPKEFTLFSFLEEQAGRAGIKSSIKYMKPSLSTDATPYKESSVEMNLEEITLRQLVEYLYLVESPENLVRLKRVSIKQSKDKPEYLTVLLHLATYQQKLPDTRP